MIDNYQFILFKKIFLFLVEPQSCFGIVAESTRLRNRPIANGDDAHLNKLG